MSHQPGPCNIGSRLELFVDDWLIESLTGCRLKLHEPTPEEVVFEFNQGHEWERSEPWGMLVEDGLYRLYYRTRKLGAKYTCAYAESDDGIHWRRPSLGLIEVNGSTDNNLILADELMEDATLTPFRDPNPDVPDDERYKAFARLRQKIDAKSETLGLLAMASVDAVRWRRLVPEPVCSVIRPGGQAFDTINVPFWDAHRGEYVGYVRWLGDDRVRDIKRLTSPDFRHWSEPAWLDYGNSPREHFYTNNVTSYPRAPHIYLAYPKRFLPKRRFTDLAPDVGICDTVLMSSRDGLHWDRRFMEAWIRPGRDERNWTYHSPTVVWPLVIVDDEVWLYVNEHWSMPTNRLRRYTLRLDGFVSVHADFTGGEMVTRPFVFEGNRMFINYATSAAGSIRVEVQDAQGKPIPGYELEKAQIIFGDQTEHVVMWEGSGDIGVLAGTAVRLRVAMHDADLFAVRFGSTPSKTATASSTPTSSPTS